MKYNIEFFQNLAKKKGGICLSESYTNGRIKLSWKCDKGHLFSLEPRAIFNRNYWCPDCTGRKQTRHTIQSLESVARNRGFELLSNEYKGGNIKLKFNCSNGHLFELTPEHLLKGIGCRECSPRRLSTIEDFKKIAIIKGGICLSLKYEGKNNKLKFKCKSGHIFYSRPGDIKNSGSWCRTCAGLELGTIEEMRAIAKSKGGECLSDMYINSSTKLKWKCKDNHTWEARPTDVKHKSWCPHCNWYKQEAKCKYILERLLNTEFRKSRRILESGYELDGYSKEYNLAFEYNGEQHYDIGRFFNKSEDKLCEMRIRDSIKLNECEHLGIKLIIIPFNKVETDTKLVSFIKNELSRHKIAFIDTDLNYLLNDFYENHSILNEIKQLVETKKGRLLSNEYVNNQSKLLVECEKKHTWTPTFNKLKMGGWCPDCAGTKKGTIEEMQKIAIDRNGRCLSSVYINSRTPLIWECSQSHTWPASPSSIKLGSWCKQCAGKSKHTIDEMLEIAKTRGGKCLSKTYINNVSKLTWQCSKGHIWPAQPKSIINRKSWCPYCSGRLKWNERD